MADYNLYNADKEFTLSGLELYYLISGVQALIDGYEITPEEIPQAQAIVNKWESRLALGRVDEEAQEYWRQFEHLTVHTCNDCCDH